MSTAPVPLLLRVVSLLWMVFSIIILVSSETRPGTTHASGVTLTPSSAKPDWRGADAGNSGQVAVNGPLITPTVSFAVTGLGGPPQGLELDNDGSILFTLPGGQISALTPSGNRKWSIETGDGFGTDLNGPASNPVLAPDGYIYAGDDSGKLWQMSDASGTARPILDLQGIGIAQTVKVGPDNTLYFGTQDGSIDHLSNSGHLLYQAAATGSVQIGGYFAGAHSRAPFRFYGEPALDSDGSLYIASSDSNPAAVGWRLGTLYKISPQGTIVWAQPLQGESVGAVVLTQNPTSRSAKIVLTADKNGTVSAFDAQSGAVLWTNSQAATRYLASLAVDAHQSVVYALNNTDSLRALDLVDGQPSVGFNNGSPVHIQGGATTSPLLDAGGNIYILGSTGTLYGLASDGHLLFAYPSGVGAGIYLTPALGPEGTLYLAGNQGTLVALTGPTLPQPTATATLAVLPTATPLQLQPSPTSSPMPGASASPTGSLALLTPTASPTALPDPTPSPSSQAEATHTAVPLPTGRAVVTPTKVSFPPSTPPRLTPVATPTPLSFSLQATTTYYKPSFRVTLLTHTRPGIVLRYNLTAAFATSDGSICQQKETRSCHTDHNLLIAPPEILGAGVMSHPRAMAANPIGTSQPACVATIRDHLGLHFVRRSDRHGNDRFCLYIGAVAPRATTLTLTFRPSIAATGRTVSPHPIVLRLVRRFPILALKAVTIHLQSSSVRSGQTLEVNVIAARHATLTYQLRFSSGQGSESGRLTADEDGYATLHLPLSIRPARSRYLGATLTVTARQGHRQASARATFTIKDSG